MPHIDNRTEVSWKRGQHDPASRHQSVSRLAQKPAAVRGRRKAAAGKKVTEMGYRSDVAIVAKKHDCAKIVEAWRKEGAGEPDFFQEDGEGCAVVKWYDVKWYPKLPEVAAVEGVLDELDESGGPYCMVRIGDDWDDIEYRSGGDERELTMHPYVASSIQILGPKGVIPPQEGEGMNGR